MKQIIIFLILFFVPYQSFAKTITLFVTEDAYLESRDATWSGSRDATSADLVTGSTNQIFTKASFDGALYNCYRIFLSFDTSVIPDEAIIVSATLRLHVVSINMDQNDGFDYVNVVEGTPASATSFVIADFDNVSTTKFITDVDSGDLTLAQLNDFPLNTSGLDFIKKDTYTIIVVRGGHDYDNITPVQEFNNIEFYASDGISSSKHPRLDITYRMPRSVGSGSIGNANLN